MKQSRLEPALAKRFRTGRACLDFLHTGGTGDWTEPELLESPNGLQRWLSHILGPTEVQIANSDSTSDLTAALRLRGALWRLAHARIQGGAFEQADVDIVNEFAATSPPISQLTVSGAQRPLIADGPAALSMIARDAVDLFAGPLGHRIRVCASADCALLFVDASRPGTRRWCSMERCGNLAKIRTHRDAKAHGA